MNVLFLDAMTVYNFFRDPETGTESWNRSVIRGVQWRHNKSEVSTSNGVQTEHKVESITVDFSRDYGNKPYVPPQEYQKIPRAEKADYWTLNEKSAKDMLILGEVNQEIGEQYRISALQEDYQYVVAVTAVSDNRNKRFLKHIKVEGK